MDMISLRQDLIRDEGLKLAPYRCTKGFLTIGVGRNLDSCPLTTEELRKVGHDGRRKPITAAQAELLLTNDITRTMESLDMCLPWWSTLDDTRRSVLFNMAFNLGVEGLKRFKDTLSSVQAGEYQEAAKCMLDSKWASQVKGRAVRLANMMRTGEV